ncbi:UNVERIFIED_CONTAM: hypothetical protein ABIC26_002610 [Paenibacillus sp. PvR008]
MGLVLLYLITVVISYVLIRERVKRQVSESTSLALEDVIIMILMAVVPVLNIIFSIRLFAKSKFDTAALVEMFFFLKDK